MSRSRDAFPDPHWWSPLGFVRAVECWCTLVVKSSHRSVTVGLSLSPWLNCESFKGWGRSYICPSLCIQLPVCPWTCDRCSGSPCWGNTYMEVWPFIQDIRQACWLSQNDLWIETFRQRWNYGDSFKFYCWIHICFIFFLLKNLVKFCKCLRDVNYVIK